MGQAFTHLVGDTCLHQEAACGHAKLTGENGQRLFDFWQRRLKVRIVENDDGGLPAQLQPETLELRGTGFRNGATSLGASCETDGGNVWRPDQIVEHLIFTGHDIDDPWWQAFHFAEHLSQQCIELGRLARHFNDRRAT